MALVSWLELGLGGGLGVLYGLAGYLTARYAACWRRKAFMLIFFGGMAARMMLALAAIAAILVLAPVQPLPFIGAFGVAFLIGLAVEVALIHRRAGR